MSGRRLGSGGREISLQPNQQSRPRLITNRTKERGVRTEKTDLRLGPLVVADRLPDFHVKVDIDTVLILIFFYPLPVHFNFLYITVPPL